MNNVIANTADIIRLNIGGQHFDTTAETLQNGAPAFFERLMKHTDVSSSRAKSLLGPREVMIDRDPQHFADVLNFMRCGKCTLPDTIAALQHLREEAEAYQVQKLLDLIDSSASIRVHRQLLSALSQQQELLQAATSALLAYAFGNEQCPAAAVAECVQVNVRVALAATAPVQGQYECLLDASIQSPAANKGFTHRYAAAGLPIESPLAADDLRSPFYHGLEDDQKVMWDEMRFMRQHADAIAYMARQGSCFRVVLKLVRPEAQLSEQLAARTEMRPVYDSTLQFEVRLV